MILWLFSDMMDSLEFLNIFSKKKSHPSIDLCQHTEFEEKNCKTRPV